MTAPAAIELVDFSDALADDFRRINTEWIAAMYTMEPTDHDVLDNPRARSMQTTTLFLVTNRKSEAAIHLYENRGFVHGAGIMDRHGRKYERCNIAMPLPL